MCRLLLVIETEHDPAGICEPAAFDVRARGCRGLVEMQDRNALEHTEDAAVTAQNAVLNLVTILLVKQRRDELKAPAAIRTAQDVECGDVHELCTGSPSCSSTPPPRFSRGERRNGSI